MESELQAAQKEGAKHIAVFQHHSWFLNSADEPDQYFNLPHEARARYLAMFHRYGVNYAFCGHYHRNQIAHDGNLEVVTTGATGKPFGGDKSGFQVVIVRDGGMEHHYYSFGEIPNQIELQSK